MAVSLPQKQMAFFRSIPDSRLRHSLRRLSDKAKVVHDHSRFTALKTSWTRVLQELRLDQVFALKF